MKTCKTCGVSDTHALSNGNCRNGHNNWREIIACVCMTCGVRNDFSTDNGYCQNGHDNWLEYQDVIIEKSQYFRQMCKATMLPAAEFIKLFLDNQYKQFILKKRIDERTIITPQD